MGKLGSMQHKQFYYAVVLHQAFVGHILLNYLKFVGVLPFCVNVSVVVLVQLGDVDLSPCVHRRYFVHATGR